MLTRGRELKIPPFSFKNKHIKEEHLKVLKQLGFKIEGRLYEEIVADLIEEHIRIMLEIETGNKKLFEDEIRRVFKPTN